MEKEIKVEIHKSNQTSREVEIEFPLYVKRSHTKYPGVTYIEYNGENECKDFKAITVPKDPEDKYAMSYYYTEEQNSGLYLEHGYLHALKNGSSDKNSYEMTTKEAYLTALELYKTNFLNKI